MSDPTDRTGSDPDGTTPPPAPWWSSPDGSGAWGAPSPARPADASAPATAGQPPYGDQSFGGTTPAAPAGDPSAARPAADARPAGQPPYGDAGRPVGDGGQPAYGEAAYGAPSYGRSASGEPAPGGWGAGAFPPGSYREPAMAGEPWGGPVDTVGRRPGRRRVGVGTVGALLATALVAGGVGGVVGSRAHGSGALLDPSASLGGSSSATATLDRPPGSVAAVAARVLRSTVSIGVRSATGSGTGSGVVIRSDGYVLTNNHVVASAKDGGQITVTSNSTGKALPAQIVGLDPDTDLAVVKVEGGGPLVPASLGQSRDLVVGDPVIAIGSPLGLEGTVTTGIVSALNRSPAVPSETGGQTFLANAIQTDAAINPGNSGGALVNAAGEVVGINSAIATLGGSGGQSGSIGIGFSIPIDEARSIAEEIIRTGRVTHPAIGVKAGNATSGNERTGARIEDVSPGSSAARAGLQPGDVLVKVDGTAVSSVDALILAIREHKVGETVTLTYQRNGETRTTQATLQDKQAN